MPRRTSTLTLKTPIRVKPLIDLDDDSIIGFYAKGHVDKTLFLEACKTWVEPDCYSELKEPSHLKARLIPNKKESLVAFHLVPDVKARGAFNVTYTCWIR